MSQYRSLLALLVGSIVALSALYFVRNRKLATAVHPTRADSIAIRLFEGGVMMMLAFIASPFGLLVPARRFLRLMGLLFLLIAALLLADSTWAWFTPKQAQHEYRRQAGKAGSGHGRVGRDQDRPALGN